MKKTLVNEEINRINFLINYDFKKILSEQKQTNKLITEDCVQSKVKINPKTGKGIYIDTSTGKPCTPNKKVDTQGVRNPAEIANFLKNSDNWDDDEIGAEKAFSEIKTLDRYNLVKQYLKQDPYKFVSQFIDVNEKYGPIQSITTSYKLIKKDIGPSLNIGDFNKMCPVKMTAQKPGGSKQYLGAANFMKFFKGSVGTPGADPLLYKKTGLGTYAKVPADFGWKFNNEIYPFPKYYTQQCLDSADKLSKISFDKNKKTSLEEIINSSDSSESTRVDKNVQQFKGPSFLTYPEAGKKKKLMSDFNQSLSKQKELIPQYCTTPLEREWQQTVGAGADYKLRMISMYNLCRDYGGLWVYGAGSSKYTCGCRDNTNPALNINLKTDTGSLNVSKSIEKQQGSTNWSNASAREVLWGVAALASAFIPVVGPFVAAGIGLGGAADLWTSNKKKEAAIAAFFSILPVIGKIPGVGAIGETLAKELETAVIKGGVLTEEQLKTLMSIIKYDEQISKSVVEELEKKTITNVQKHLLKTAIKKTESKLVSAIGLPTYGDLKKKVQKSALEPVLNKTIKA